MFETDWGLRFHPLKRLGCVACVDIFELKYLFYIVQWIALPFTSMTFVCYEDAYSCKVDF